MRPPSAPASPGYSRAVPMPEPSLPSSRSRHLFRHRPRVPARGIRAGGLGTPRRSCADLGILLHAHRHQPRVPEAVGDRLAEKPAGIPDPDCLPYRPASHRPVRLGRHGTAQPHMGRGALHAVPSRAATHRLCARRDAQRPGSDLEHNNHGAAAPYATQTSAGNRHLHRVPRRRSHRLARGPGIGSRRVRSGPRGRGHDALRFLAQHGRAPPAAIRARPP